MTVKKKRNPQDATMRNVRSLCAAIGAVEARVADLETVRVADIRRAFECRTDQAKP